jgi:pyruvate dehydrogenase E1 component beta subunit
MPKRNLVEALNRGLMEEMERDPAVVILGEDVGREGGVFRVTDGLQARFGADRVIDTPLAESGIVGAAFGMAVKGLRPVAEIQFEGFLAPAMDQIMSHIARIRTRSRGRFTSPLVIRSPSQLDHALNITPTARRFSSTPRGQGCDSRLPMTLKVDPGPPSGMPT